MSVRVVSGAVVGSMAAAAILAMTAAPAHAHNGLERTKPAAGETVATVPSAVVLTFDKPALALGSAVRVVGPAGNIAVGKPVLVDNEVRQPVRDGAPAGKYIVTWRITSVDGHPISDRFSFTAKTAGTRGPSPAAASTPLISTVSESNSGGESTPWPSIVIAGAAGAALGAVIVRVRRKRGPPR